MSAPRTASLWGPLLAYLALLFYLSSRRSLSIEMYVYDKALHFAGYAVLGVLAVRAFHGGLGPLRLKPTLLAIGAAVLYAISDEFHQSFVPGRDASALDVVADAIGILFAVLALRIAIPWIPRGARSSDADS